MQPVLGEEDSLVSKVKTSGANQDRAKAAINKPASLGEDIDLGAYVSSADEQPYQPDPSQLPAPAKEDEISSKTVDQYDTSNEESGFDSGDIDEETLQAETGSNSDENESDGPQSKLSEADRQNLNDIINQMRTEGNSWENIARHISSIGYPTVSGKGQWRGGMVKNLYEKMVS